MTGHNCWLPPSIPCLHLGMYSKIELKLRYNMCTWAVSSTFCNFFIYLWYYLFYLQILTPNCNFLSFTKVSCFKCPCLVCSYCKDLPFYFLSLSITGKIYLVPYGCVNLKLYQISSFLFCPSLFPFHYLFLSWCIVWLPP